MIGGGISMLIIRKLMWNRGYFAHFFFHTRFQPFIYMTIIYSLISLNFTENLKKNDVYFYYTNRRRTEQFNKLTKDQALKQEINREKAFQQFQSGQ